MIGRSKIIIAILLFTLLLCSYGLNAQKISTTDKKVMLIYKFAKNIKWHNEKKLDDFRIGVFSDDENFIKELRILETVKLKNKEISIIRFKEINEITNIQLLVITKDKNQFIEKISSKILGKNTLLISDQCKKKDFIMINFLYSKEKKVDFETNKRNVMKENLVIMPNLFLLGGTEIDIIELYKESQKSLESVNRKVKGLKNDLINKKKEITKRNNEILKQKIEIEKQKAKLKAQKEEINGQLNTITEQKENLLKNSLELNEQHKQLESKIKESRLQEFEIITSRKILKNLNVEIKNKQNEIEKQKTDITTYESKVERQSVYIYFAVAIAIMLLVMAFIIYRWFLIKKRTAKILTEKEAEIRMLFDIAPLPIVMTSIVSKKARYINKLGEELFKLQPGKALEEISTDYYVFPEQQKEVISILRKIGKINNHEVLFKNSKGEHFDALLSGRITKFNNEIVFFVAINDITERKKYLEEIKDKNLKLKEQTERITFTNKQLVASEEELRQNGEELTTINEKLAFQKDELAKTLENLHETQSHLIQSEKMASLGVLTAGIAHEINNPVTYINAGIVSLELNINEFNEILKISDEITIKNTNEKLKQLKELKEKLDYELLIPETQKLIGGIKDGTERVTNIVKGLRTFSRLDEDVLKFADIQEGLDSTLIMLRSRYKDRIKIIKNYGKIAQIECYPGKLNQVFMNVLSNAIDAIESSGSIWITTSYGSGEKMENSNNKNKFILISIKDNGKGMPEGFKSKIFEPFFTTKVVGKGTGLGLSISHGIIKKHNGTIEVNCSKEYTEFIIKLPANRSDTV